MPTPTDFLPWIFPEAPGAPQALVEREILDAAIRFCERAMVWEGRYEVPVTVQPTAAVFAIPAITAVRVASIKSVKVQTDTGQIIDLAPSTQLDEFDINAQHTVKTGKPTRFYFQTANDVQRLVFNSVPDYALPWKILVIASLKPERMPAASAATIPELIFQNYLDAVVAGAKARLFRMPNKTWSNPELAQAEEVRFLSECNNAKVDTRTGLAGVQRRVQGRRIR